MRILFVALADNLKTARWIDQLTDTGWDIHLFAAEGWNPLHPDLHDLTVHNSGLWRIEGIRESVRLAGRWPWRRGAWSLYRWRQRLGWERRSHIRLARVIARLKPDVVHSIEMQRSGYLTLAARRLTAAAFPPWIYTCWGSDLYHFHSDPRHGPRIREVLASCTHLMTDCDRDTAMARDLGFTGDVLGVFPGGGGYPVECMAAFRAVGPARNRRMLIVKGYQNVNYGGRALIALQAVHLCADVLRDCPVLIYHASDSVRVVAEHIRRVSGLDITVAPELPHRELLASMGKARVHLAVSTTDGTPNAMLEAMVLGALPVQSDTVSTGEWIQHGVNGLLTPPEDADAIAGQLRRALTDDGLVDRADAHNAQMARQRLDRVTISRAVRAAYESVARVTT
jgi:hypothetical protein